MMRPYSLFRRRLAAHGADTRVQFLSQVRPHDAGTAWRFCYTLDLAQYAPDHQQMLTRGRIRYVNPLFHGYGTKLLPAPLFHPKAAPDLARTLGASTMAVLCDGFTGCRPITPADLPDLAEHRRSWVLKVTDSPADRSVTWGSRGVYFGDHSAASWNRFLAAAAASHRPGRPDQPAQYMATRLVESDRYDVPFLHPDGSRGALMTRARIRLAPIFFRDAKGVRLVAGHATFVNTSRKVYLGRHAVCAPLDWARIVGPNTSPAVTVPGIGATRADTI